MRFIRKLNAFNERRRVKAQRKHMTDFGLRVFIVFARSPRLTAVTMHSGRFFSNALSQMLYVNVSQKRI